MSVQEYVIVNLCFAVATLLLYWISKRFRSIGYRSRRLNALDDSVLDLDTRTIRQQFEIKKLVKRVKFLEQLNAVKPRKQKRK